MFLTSLEYEMIVHRMYKPKRQLPPVVPIISDCTFIADFAKLHKNYKFDKVLQSVNLETAVESLPWLCVSKSQFTSKGCDTLVAPL